MEHLWIQCLLQGKRCWLRLPLRVILSIEDQGCLPELSLLIPQVSFLPFMFCGNDRVSRIRTSNSMDLNENSRKMLPLALALFKGPTSFCCVPSKQERPTLTDGNQTCKQINWSQIQPEGGATSNSSVDGLDYVIAMWWFPRVWCCCNLVGFQCLQVTVTLCPSVIKTQVVMLEVTGG